LKRFLILIALLALLAAGCAEESGQDEEGAGGPESSGEETQYSGEGTSGPETTVVEEVTTEETLPATGR
jgi:hypothetical protein